MAHIRKEIETVGVLRMLQNAGCLDSPMQLTAALGGLENAQDLGLLWGSRLFTPAALNQLSAYGDVPRSVRWHGLWSVVESFGGMSGLISGGAAQVNVGRTVADSVVGWSADMWSRPGDTPPSSMPVPLAHKLSNRFLRHGIEGAAISPSGKAPEDMLVFHGGMFLALRAAALGSCTCGVDHQAEFEAVMREAVSHVVRAMLLVVGLDLRRWKDFSREEMDLFTGALGSFSTNYTAMVVWDMVLDGAVLCSAPGGAA